MNRSGRGATRGTSHMETTFGEDICEGEGLGVVQVSWRESGDASVSGVFESRVVLNHRMQCKQYEFHLDI